MRGNQSITYNILHGAEVGLGLGLKTVTHDLMVALIGVSVGVIKLASATLVAVVAFTIELAYINIEYWNNINKN